MAETQRCMECGQIYTPASKLEYDARACPACVAKKVGGGQAAPAPLPPDSEAGIDRAALQRAMKLWERGVDAIYSNALSVSRLLELGPEDVPRLCVMAGNRMAERMIEAYQMRRAQTDEGGVRKAEAVQDLERRKAEIGAAIELLIHTLADGLTAAQHIQKSLELKVNVQ